jgi:methylated-DNA-[protein]-cysteine S-methyltransferase
MGEHSSRNLDYALFDTAIGRCGIVWSARGIVGVQFPEGGEQATRKRLLRRHPNACETIPPIASGARSRTSSRFFAASGAI